MARREFNPDAPYGALEFTLKRHPELLPADGKILLLHPRAHAVLRIFDPKRSVCVTPECQDVARFEQRGYHCSSAFGPHTALPRDAFALCVTFPGESRDEALYLLALGASSLQPGGILLSSMSNDLGAARFEGKVAEMFGSVESQSKNHCRVFWGQRSAPIAEGMLSWLSLGHPQKITGTTFQSVPGLFSWNKIDQGSKLLAAHLPPLSGKVADLGCGYGYLATEILASSPEVRELALFDSDQRAIETSRLNLSSFERSSTRISFCWEDVHSHLSQRGFNFVVMNPPFHEYGTLRVELGRRFFAKAAELLIPGGTLFAVVNRHLPYDAALWGLFDSVEDIVVEQGYRVLKARTR
ncbi:MAG: class I SAM-dependent methyltransferase [Proteobacteria bacterium]|nr:class I SAM-dependent methyltransferase [Pseudomonadota bacterium]